MDSIAEEARIRLIDNVFNIAPDVSWEVVVDMVGELQNANLHMLETMVRTGCRPMVTNKGEGWCCFAHLGNDCAALQFVHALKGDAS